jgi:hypothetical protein
MGIVVAAIIRLMFLFQIKYFSLTRCVSTLHLYILRVGRRPLKVSECNEDLPGGREGTPQMFENHTA